MQRVLITGVRAKTGAPLAELLAAQPGVETLGGTSSPDRVETPGVRAVEFSWSDPATWDEATSDVDSVFIVRPDREDAPELMSRFLSITPRHAHAVLLSEFDNGYFSKSDWAPTTERAVRESGRSWTILRPGWFMQVFTDSRFMLGALRDHARLAFPSGGQQVSWIDARDIAAVAERAILEDEHGGKTYEITGPEALSLPRTAAILSDAVGRDVEHVDLTMAEALAGAEGFARRNDEGAFARVQMGLATQVTDTVEEVTGSRARSLEQFAQDHRTVLR